MAGDVRTLVALYVVIHYLFVSQSSQMLALFGELYQLGFFVTLAFLLVFPVIGTPWVMFVTR